MRKQLVLVEALVPKTSDSDAHPEHPIYIPITPPPDSGLHPEHPIYLPVHIWGGGNEPFPTPPIFLPGPPSDAHPEHPIYYPIQLPPFDPDAHPEHPIVLPPEIGDGLTDEQKEKLYHFLVGNLPPYEGGPDTVQPV